MTPERWRRIEELYHAACDLEPNARSTFLAEACAADEELRRDVEELLNQNSGSFSRLADRIRTEALPEPSATQLAPSSSLGQYRIVEHLGQGGMGTVYKATDTKLGREVALKLLRPELLDNPAAVARFEREARILASLNHAHIAAIYDLEEHNGVRFLALEYVPGPTLAGRLRRGPLSVPETLRISIQIAEALEAAHAKDIIHRDLKPANIKLSGNDQVKVLDFGLAKTLERPRASGPDMETLTIQQQLTQKMTVVGTPAYMSPEQARGEALDARTDIWSFGCVLYAQLTGRAVFAGKTVVEVLAAIVEREPDWAALPRDLPASLLTLLKRCLRKDRDKRLRNIADARLELEDVLAPEQDLAVPASAAPTRRLALSALTGAVAGAAGVGVFAIRRYRGAVPRKLTQFAVQIPDGKLHNVSFNRRLAISRDGTAIAFNTSNASGAFGGAFLRRIGELESKLIKGMPSGAALFFSADGRSIVFNALTGMNRIALSGGAPVVIARTDYNFFGGTWADGDVIYFVPELPSGIASVPVAGGEAKEVVKIDFDRGERQHKYPCAIPGTDAVLFTTAMAENATFDDARIAVFSRKTGRTKVLVEGGTQPCFSPSGHLLYARDAKIFAVRFDPDSQTVSGQPFPVLDGVLMSRNTGAANFDVSASGDLAYTPGICDGGARTLVWVDRNGKADPIPLPARSYLHPRFSPDDRRLAIEIEGPSHDLYVYDFDRAVLSNLTTDGVSHWPVWSPDGTRLSYRSGPMSKFRIWQVPADRSRPPAMVPAVGGSQSAESWSPDGRAIAYTAAEPGAPAHVMLAYVDGSREAQEFAGSKAPEGSPKFSPDGRWLAYCSNENGEAQVYVQAFPGPGAKIQISGSGGTDPVWRRKGSELYYRNGDSMMVVDVSGDSTFGRPRELWKGHYSHGMSSSCGPPGATSSNYDVTADGKRFLMIKDDAMDRATSRQIVVALDWADKVNQMAPQA